MSKKKTIVEMFEQIKANYNLTEEEVAFIDKRIEVTQNKNAKNASGERKPTKTQEANIGIKEEILSVLDAFDEVVNITTLQKANPNLMKLSSQKISALLTQLVRDNKVKRTEVKGRAYFALASKG